MADERDDEEVRCGNCQSLHGLEAILDSHLDYWAGCECFVAECPGCKDRIVLDAGGAGELSVGQVRGYGSRPDIWDHQRLSFPSLVAGSSSAGPVLSYRGRVWLPGARAEPVIPPGADLAHLARLARDPDADSRRQAAELLGVAGQHDRDQAVGALRQALRDEDAGVALAAIDAPQRLAREAAQSELGAVVPVLLHSWDYNPPRSLDTLVALGEPALRMALGMLGDVGPIARRLIIRHLGGRGVSSPEALDALLGALADQDVAVRRQAAIAAGWLGPAARRLLPALIDGSGSDDQPLRRLSLRAIGEIGGCDVAVLTGQLGDNDPEVRREAALALAKMGPAAASAVPHLAGRLSDADVSVRLQAASALRRIGPGARGALPELRGLLRDANERVRMQAGIAIKEIEA
jgi:HEAT repeat protein